ncbi:UNVERIFIED_CONTAM: Transcription factor [Sesamum latifolium]|uniref:Transcription factor n=1 Tax=Sesamum latifolium TaxID=2727402 RepID=A0AAW2TQV7_9LAMI
MAEDFQGGVCGGNWWNPPRNLFGSSPCASAINDMGSFGWLQNHDLMMDVSTGRSISDDSAGSVASDGASSVLIQDVQKPQQPTGDGNMPMFASTTDDWNQDLLHDHSGRSEDDYSRMLQEAAGLNYQQTTTDVVNHCPDQNHKNWSAKNFCEDSSINSFKQVINQSFPLEQQPSNSLTSSTQCLPTDSQGLSTTFPLMNSASYSYSTSCLLQTLFDTDSDQPHEQSLLDNQATNYSSYPNHRMNSTEFLPSLTKAPTTSKPSLAKQQPANHLPFTNNTTFWNAMAAASGASVLPSTQPRFLPPPMINSANSNLPNISAKHHKEEDQKDLASAVKKFSNEPSFKRPRIETPSPLPTFKVRKEKLGDRITALQQLVSPFGKTDTASVLHEAIEYIKFLHDQVSVLSTPYLKNATPPLQRCPQAGDKNKDQEGPIQDLKSRGLCLVPISSTFPVAAETTADFWTPTFGGSFR